jgi:putative transposase
MDNNQRFGWKTRLLNITLSKLVEKEFPRSLMPVVESGGRIKQMFPLIDEFNIQPRTGHIKILDLLEQCFRKLNSALVERKHWFEVYCRTNACFFRIDVEFTDFHDMENTNFLTIFYSLLVKRQSFLKDTKRKLKPLQQGVRKKNLNFNHWCKTQKKVVNQDEYITNNRKDGYRKLSHQIYQNVEIVSVEELNVINLSKAMLWKHCLTTNWSHFFTTLEQTCLRYGIYFQKVSAHKMSQVCHNCLTEIEKKLLDKCTHLCSNSGYTTDEDVGSAQVGLIKTLATIGYKVKTFAEGKFIGIATNQEFPRLYVAVCQLGWLQSAALYT